MTCNCASEGNVCVCTPEDCGCELTRQKLEDLLRDELCAEESAPIRSHLEHCPDCQAEERVCRSLTDAVQRGCKEQAPRELRDAILAQLQLAS